MRHSAKIAMVTVWFFTISISSHITRKVSLKKKNPHNNTLYDISKALNYKQEKKIDSKILAISESRRERRREGGKKRSERGREEGKQRKWLTG